MFVTTYDPPLKRKPNALNGIEERLNEAAVMLAIATHILSDGRKGQVRVHPDGEHSKRFDIPRWLAESGFEKISGLGSTDYGGVYRRGEQDIIINPKSGLGDVTGVIDGRPVHVECKGGTINTTHAGQISKLRRGLCEAVGLLMARQSDEAREIAAVPWTPVTERLAKSMSGRCMKAGIEIALVRRDGSNLWDKNIV
jgi:hypothetical protein